MIMRILVACYFATFTGLHGQSFDQPVRPSALLDSVQIHRTDTVYFAFGSDELDEVARTRVQGLVEDRPAQLQLYVEGHTDAVGSSVANEALARRRCEAVVEMAVTAGWPPEAIEIRHFGERRPVVITQAREPKNRRVLLRSGLPKRYVAFRGVITGEDRQPLPGKVIAHGRYLKDTALAGADGTYRIYLPIDEEVRVDVFARDHFFSSRRLRLAAADSTRVALETRLPAATAGKRLNVNDLYFVGNRTDFLPGSLPALERLLHFLRFSPDLHIELAGHVNHPGEPKGPGTWQFELAQARADTVAAYLVSNGIDPERLIARGYSNFEMVNPKPRGEREMRANRRVEIRIR